ncbi:MAG: peroxiredoxin family protein [Oceanihabitans sp.]
MKAKQILFLLLFFQSIINFAQNKYAFIPNNQKQLTEKQLEIAQISITPDVLLFSEKGKILDASNMVLMTNPEYQPLFFANNQGNVKSVVFIKKNNAPNIIPTNKEAQFTKGEPALDFIATDLSGKRYKLSELRGKVVVLNFWFTKCSPCVMEIPDLNHLTSFYKEKEVVFLAITFNKKEIVKPFLKKHPFKYAILADANAVVDSYNVNSFPTNIIINKKGEIVYKGIGYRTNIKAVLKAAINENL